MMRGTRRSRGEFRDATFPAAARRLRDARQSREGGEPRLPNENGPADDRYAPNGVGWTRRLLIGPALNRDHDGGMWRWSPATGLSAMIGIGTTADDPSALGS